MPEMTKNEAVIEALTSAGYQQITLKVVPKLFEFKDGPCQTELEFSRSYFDDLALATLQSLMREKILPALKQHLGKKIYVTANGLSIIPRMDEPET